MSWRSALKTFQLIESGSSKLLRIISLTVSWLWTLIVSIKYLQSSTSINICLNSYRLEPSQVTHKTYIISFNPQNNPCEALHTKNKCWRRSFNWSGLMLDLGIMYHAAVHCGKEMKAMHNFSSETSPKTGLLYFLEKNQSFTTRIDDLSQIVTWKILSNTYVIVIKKIKVISSLENFSVSLVSFKRNKENKAVCLCCSVHPLPYLLVYFF